VGGEAFSDDMLLSFTDIPAMPAMPAGPDYVLIDNTFVSEYSIDPVEDATAYHWAIEPAEAGIFTCDEPVGTIVWNRNFAGTAYISVSGLSDCGESVFSEGLAVTVDNSAVGVTDPMSAPFALSVYPNPVSETLNISVSGESVNNLEIRMVDMMGKTVITCKGLNPARVSVNLLKPGVYILIATSDTYQVTRKVIVR
jgi:hypothetical protein